MTASAGERVSKIVLTGGPGGGKTTAADLFRREIGESGGRGAGVGHHLVRRWVSQGRS
ncbi:MAG: hypothetical protein M5U19_02030 [Microthrixaceae bacterium]|nr:hypothetical protein [Microthrixaceae bacterium]